MLTKIKNSQILLSKIENKHLFVKKVKEKHNLDDNFLRIINKMTLEDLISLKLSISNKNINYKLWNLFDKVVKVSLLNVVSDFTNNLDLKVELLGITKEKYKKLLEKYKK